MLRNKSARLLLSLSLALSVLATARTVRAQEQSDCDKYYDDGNLKRAKKACDAEIANTGKPASSTTYYKRASIFLIEQKYDEGVRWIEAVAEKKFPNDPFILEVKAALLFKISGRMNEAVEAAEKAVAKDPSRFIAQKILGDYYSKPNVAKPKEAAAAYEAYLKYRPEEAAKLDGLTLIALGYSYASMAYNAGEVETKKVLYRKAEAQFDKALAIPTKDSNVASNAQKGKCTTLVARADVENDGTLYDKAITVCESVIKSRKGMTGDASPYYNVCTAYLERNQLDKAVVAANSYIQAKPNNYRGYLLRGRIYFKQNKFVEAEGEFSHADQLLPNDTEVALARGKNFLAQKQPQKAIALLEKAAAAKPTDVEVLTELARAYLGSSRAKDAATTAEKALALPGQANNKDLLVLAGDAYYASDELPAARTKYLKAHEIDKNNISAKNGAIYTIVREASAKLAKDDVPGAQAKLMEGYAIDPTSTMINFNLGVLALDAGKYEQAVKYLKVRYDKTPNDLPTNRLLGKAYMNLNKPKEAGEFYARAEEEAKRLRQNSMLAEIYTEWGPLLLDAGKTDEAVEKLEIADQYSLNQPFQKATQGNLQKAYFKRGYERWKARKYNDAVADLQGATHYPANLTKSEEDAFTFALGLAYLSTGDTAKALPIFQKYSKLGVLPFLKPPWDKIGAEFFMAYAWYREGSAGSRKQAAATFEKLLPKSSGGIAVKMKELARSSYEYIAWDAYAHGNGKEAEVAYKKADSYAAANDKAAIDHNLAVLNMNKKGGNSEAVFTRLGDNPPEALLNLGILKDQAGDARKAYDLWVQARAKGVNSAKLNEWIDAKKKIFNF